jgi:hypothetical protein
VALSTVISLSVAATIASNPITGSTVSANWSKSYGASLINGTVAGAADVAWWSLRPLTASATENIDFAGALADPSSGATLTFARIKALIISALATNTNNVVVGGGTTTFTGLFGATTHTTILRPGATAMWVAGPADVTAYPVTASSTDLLQIANSAAGTSVSYEITVIGTSV